MCVNKVLKNHSKYEKSNKFGHKYAEGSLLRHLMLFINLGGIWQITEFTVAIQTTDLLHWEQQLGPP